MSSSRNTSKLALRHRFLCDKRNQRSPLPLQHQPPFFMFPFVRLLFRSSQLSNFLTRFQDVARNDWPTTMNCAVSSSLNRSPTAVAQVQVSTVFDTAVAWLAPLHR